MLIDTTRDYVTGECRSARNAFSPAFFEEHLSVVVGYARQLGQTLGGDLEIIELAGWLHDLSAIQDFAVLPRHPAASAEIARRMLLKEGYPADRIERVATCIASHSAPVQVGNGSIEQVCVSNADAMSQIVKPAYWFYYVFNVRQFAFADGRDWLRQRVENNWTALIPQARAIIEKPYLQVGECLKL